MKERYKYNFILFNNFILILGFLLMFLIDGFLIAFLFNNFVSAPFGLKKIGIINAIGLDLLITYITMSISTNKDSRKMSEVIIKSYYVSLSTFLIGCILKLFM